MFLISLIFSLFCFDKNSTKFCECFWKFEPGHEKICLWGSSTWEDMNQSVYLYSMIKAIKDCLESVEFIEDTCIQWRPWLDCLDMQDDLIFCWQHFLKQIFLHIWYSGYMEYRHNFVEHYLALNMKAWDRESDVTWCRIKMKELFFNIPYEKKTT